VSTNRAIKRSIFLVTTDSGDPYGGNLPRIRSRSLAHNTAEQRRTTAETHGDNEYFSHASNLDNTPNNHTVKLKIPQKNDESPPAGLAKCASVAKTKTAARQQKPDGG